MTNSATDMMIRSAYLGAACLLGGPAVARADEIDPLRYGTEDRYVKVEPFLQLDGGYASSSPRGLLGDDRGWSSQVRRARIYTDFAYEDVGGRVTVDFANLTGSAIPYAYLYHRFTNALTVQAGQQDVPFSLENITGSRAATFNESAASGTLAPGGGTGVVAQWQGDRATLTGGAFSGNINSRAFDEGLMLAARGTLAPWKDGEDAVHIGLGLLARFDPRQPLSFSADAGTPSLDTSLISTGNFDAAERYQAINIETAMTIGRFFAQAEAVFAQVDDRSRDDANLKGGYVYAGFFLTDDHRRYQADGGQFLRVDPSDPVTGGGLGAIELAGRLQFLDLDGARNADNSSAGRQVQVGSVVNWYLTKQLRLSADYTYTAVRSGENKGADAQAAFARMWFVY